MNLEPDHLQLTLLNWDTKSVLALNKKLKFPIHFQFFIQCQKTFGDPIELSKLHMIRPYMYVDYLCKLCSLRVKHLLKNLPRITVLDPPTNAVAMLNFLCIPPDKFLEISFFLCFNTKSSIICSDSSLMTSGSLPLSLA